MRIGRLAARSVFPLTYKMYSKNVCNSAILVYFLLLTPRVTASNDNQKVEDVCPQLEQLIDREGEEYVAVYDDSCFYFAVNRKVNYAEASVFCQEQGGLLAMPKSQEINAFIQNKLKNDLGISLPVWIGMNDTESEGNYVWADGADVTYNNSGFSGDTDLDCVTLDPWFGHWHHQSCTEKFTKRSRNLCVCQFTKHVNEEFSDNSTKTEDVTDGKSNVCPPFTCLLDCFPFSYRVDSNGCTECECDF